MRSLQQINAELAANMRERNRAETRGDQRALDALDREERELIDEKRQAGDG